MKLNSFKVRTGKPMVDSMESAREFLSQCKVAFDLVLPDGKTFFTFYAGKDYIPCMVGKYERVDEFTDFECDIVYGDKAVKACYQYRKYINAYFRN